MDAERLLLGVEDAKLPGAHVDPAAGKVNFREWAERWYKTTADLKPSRRHTYRQLLDYQVLLTFERATLAGIDMLLVRLDACTGLRAGELAALRVGRLDPLCGTCEVVESATEVDNKLVWGVTKTYERRTVRLPRFLCEQVGAYLVDRPHAPNDLVFTMLQGGPLREPKFAERYFKLAARAADLPAGPPSA